MTTLEGAQSDQPDHHLLVRVRAGDAEAYGVLYRRHLRAASLSARQLVDPLTAEDVVAEAFVRVFRLCTSGRGPTGEFRPYLLRSVRNTALNQYRSREYPADLGTVPRRVLKQLDRDPLDRVPAGIATRRAMLRLPERWRLVLWLVEVEGYDRHAVGRMLGLRPDAVSALAMRARKGLLMACLDLDVDVE